MAKKINIPERIKVFGELTGMSKKELELRLKAIQFTQKNRENTIDDELKELEEYLENYERKTVKTMEDREIYRKKEEDYQKLYSIMKSRVKNNSQEEVSPEIKEEAEKISRMSKEELEEKALLIRVCLKVVPEIVKAKRVIEEIESEFEGKRKDLEAKKQKAKETNKAIDDLDKKIEEKRAKIKEAKTEEEQEKINLEYERLIGKRSRLKKRSIKQYDKDLAKLEDEYISSEEIKKAEKTIIFLTDRTNFEVIDKMSEEQLRTAIENGTLEDQGKTKPEEGKAGEGKAGESKAGESKAGEGKAGEGKAGEGKPEEGEPEEGEPEEGEPEEGEPEEGEPEEGEPEEGEPEEDDEKRKLIVALMIKHPILGKSKFLLNRAVKKLERKARKENFIKGFMKEHGSKPSKFKIYLAKHPKMRKFFKTFSKYKTMYDEIEQLSKGTIGEIHTLEDEAESQEKVFDGETFETSQANGETPRTASERRTAFREQIHVPPEELLVSPLDITHGKSHEEIMGEIEEEVFRNSESEQSMGEIKEEVFGNSESEQSAEQSQDDGTEPEQ